MFAQRLLGTWVGEEIEKTFHVDGTATGFLHSPGAEEENRVTFKSLWRVENGFLLGKVLESSYPEELPPGYEFKDKILFVNAKMEEITGRPAARSLSGWPRRPSS